MTRVRSLLGVKVASVYAMKKFFALYVFAIIAVVISTTTARAGTIAHWTFEEGTPGATASGVGTIIDSSGNNLHGRALGGTV